MMLPSEAHEATLEFWCSSGRGSVARRAVAELLAAQLEDHGYSVMGVDDDRDEDISWVELANIPPFVLQVAIGEHPRGGGWMLASLYPPLPYVRVWLRKVSTLAVVTDLGEATQSILGHSSICSDVRWLSEEEVRRLWL